MGSLAALDSAESVLDRAVTQRTAVEIRRRVFDLAEALFQSARMQLSVPLYRAIGVDRGATLDNIDFPLNNRGWLRERFSSIRRSESEPERLKQMQEILEWTNPGAGGFYDDLGNPWNRPHLVTGPGFEKDPAFLESALAAFGYRFGGRLQWWRHGETRDDTPLEMRYAGLDPSAGYRLRVVYAGDPGPKRLRLLAGNDLEVHPYQDKPQPYRPQEFAIPPAAYRDGSLRLRWFREEGAGGAGRGPQIAEVWLLRR
jgi:hypothetical protein